jgi:hypothetical protein
MGSPPVAVLISYALNSDAPTISPIPYPLPPTDQVPHSGHGFHQSLFQKSRLTSEAQENPP